MEGGVHKMTFLEIIKSYVSPLIGLIALILSQLRPIREMIKGTKLRINVADFAQFYHFFGNTNMSLWIDLENVGGKSISVREISCFLKSKSSGEIQTVIAKTYWLTLTLGTDNPTELPISEIVLNPGDRWSGYLHFWGRQVFDKSIEIKVKSITKKIRDDIEKKLNQQKKDMSGPPKDELPLVEADPKLINEAEKIVNTLRKLEVDEYDLLVVAYGGTKNKSPLKILGYDFTLFETDIRDIFEDIEDYKYGYGVYLKSEKTKWVRVQIRSKGQKESEELFKKIKDVS